VIRPLRALRVWRLRHDDFPWPHWELTDHQGHGVRLWPIVAPHICDTDCPDEHWERAK
jgi:hypothetical protein